MNPHRDDRKSNKYQKKWKQATRKVYKMQTIVLRWNVTCDYRNFENNQKNSIKWVITFILTEKQTISVVKSYLL